MVAKKENRGGKRNGAGRPKVKKEYSEEFKKGLTKALKKYKKDHGVNVYEAMVAMMMEKDTQDACRVGIFKIVADVMVDRGGVHKVENNDNRQIIMLPPVNDVPKLAETTEGKGD